MSKRNRILALLILTVIVLIGIYQAMKGNASAQKIKNDPAHTIAQVTELIINPKSKMHELAYSFSVGSSTYFEKAAYKPLTAASDSLLNRYFPVIYSKEDPSLNHLLITETDFKLFDEEQPDSLKPHNTLIQ